MPRRNLVVAGIGLAAVVVIALVLVLARQQKNANPAPGPTCTPTALKVPLKSTVVVPKATPAPASTVAPASTEVPTSAPVPTATCTPLPKPVKTRAIATATATRRPKPTASNTPARPTAKPTSTRRPTATPIPTATPHPAFVPGPLNGERTAWAIAHRRPLAVMVENYNPDSRPQTGLSSASVVFETVAEGGITRFMPIYLENDPPVVGPVRSARVYFDAWANGLHVILVHVGGNDDALAQLFTLHNIADLNEVAFEDANFNPTVPFFFRSPDRVIPHNLYAYPPKVREYLKKHHVKLSGDFPDKLPHKNPNNPIHLPHGGTLDINFSSPDYAVEYQFDRNTDRYLRFMGGAPHIEASSNHQLAPSNVVVLMASIAPDPYGGPANPGAVYVQSTGKNVAYYFRDGKRFKGTWHKPYGSSHLLLLDDHKRPFRFNPGQTWIEVLPADGSMTWTPGK